MHATGHATQARKRQAGHHLPLSVAPARPPLGRSRRRKAITIASALLVLAAIAGGTYLVRARTTPPPVAMPRATVTVGVGPVVGALTLSGRLDLEQAVRVGTSAPGQVVAVAADVGDTVRRGQVLARLDDLEQRTAVVAADVQRTMADLQLTRAELRLLESAGVAGDFLQGVPFEELLENADSDAQLDAMTAAAQLARQKALVRLARGQLARRTVRAPADGVVAARGIERGETILASPPGPPLFVLDVRPGHLLLRVQLDERHVSRVQSGPVRVAIPSNDRSLVGEVLGVTGPVALSSTNDGPVRYAVDIALTDVDGSLRPGLSATVSLPMSSAGTALRVPVAAIAVDETGAPRAGASAGWSPGTLWLTDGSGPARPYAVGLGVTDGQMVEVDGPGVRAGMRAQLTTSP